MADVVGDVPDVGPEADHRRLVADGAHPGDSAGGGARVAEVALDPLRPRIQVVGALPVRAGQERVEDSHVVAVIEQGVDDVGADEAGAAGDEDRSGHGRPYDAIS